MIEKLTAKQGKVLACLLASPTVEAAAKTAGVSRQTVYDYLAQDDFSTAYRAAIAQAVDGAAAFLQASTAAAAGVLVALMNDESVNVNARIQAATAVLNQAGKAVDLLKKSSDYDIEKAIENAIRGQLNG